MATTKAKNQAETFRPGMTRTLWVSKDGRKVPVVRMADTHLLNAIKVIDKATEVFIRAGRDRTDVVKALVEVVPCYPLMLIEKEKRGLR